jgi:hypothetical protein|tara:strand:- start:581 stop:940 length:360 start_codon:yes stop_codon:yes gene_type:complete
MKFKGRLDPSSFYIQLKPVVDDENDWTGELEVNILHDRDNPLKKDGLIHLAHLTDLVACSIAYMEENPDYYTKMEEFLSSPDNDEGEYISFEERVDDRIEKVEGNVVKLSFQSRTKGSA